MDTRSSALAAAAGAALGGLAVYVLSRRRDDGPPPAPAPRQTFRHFPVRGPLQRSYSLAATSLGEDATVRVVCYGDSNTWGFDAFSPAAAREGVLCRFCEGGRWPRVAQKLLGPGYAVVEEGLNGRTTVHPDPLMGDYDANGRATLAAILHSHKPFDVVVLMLGTNDLKTHLALTPEQIAKGASTLVGDVFKMGVTRSAERPKAEAHGCAFLDANDVFAIPDPAKEGGDGIHLSPANAKALGAAVAAKVESMMA
ncbi:GDSL-like Lipase/Acylhydrolase [Aureococcus anophagefferens]|nr:GDSL-like Lipase/Acylhydrolase [Aureococcus anophagefferens]